MSFQGDFLNCISPVFQATAGLLSIMHVWNTS